MKGWVYIISNKAMQGVIKIGFSRKDPRERAAELGTGAPYPYTVEYEALIDNPRQIEKLVHEMLAFVNAGKEWFECDVSVALKAIKKVCENRTIYFESHANNAHLVPSVIASKSTQLPIPEIMAPSFIISTKLPKSETPALNLKLTTQVVTPAPKQLPITEITTLKSKSVGKPIATMGKKSIQELTQLAKDGSAEAQYELGVRYDQGDGVRKNLKEAYRLFVNASSQGHILANLVAGKAHLKGRGAEKSEEKAVPFIIKAAYENNAEAQYYLSELAFMGHLTPSQCNQGSSDEFAFHAMQKSADLGYIPAYRKMGHEYFMQGNYRLAFQWYKKSAEHGDIAGQNDVASFYLEGCGCQRDLNLALQWYTSSAKGGHKTAKKRIAEWGTYIKMYEDL